MTAAITTFPTTAGPASGCDACGAPTGDGVRLCRADQRQLLGALDELAGLVVELEITRSRQDRMGANARRRDVHAERPLPWNEHAAGVADVVASTVIAWAIDCHHRDTTPPDDQRDPLSAIRPADLPAVIRWLRRALPVLRLHPEAGLAYQQLAGITARARRAVDLPRTASCFVVGPCPERLDPHEDDPTERSRPCEGTVYAAIGLTEDMPSVMRCNGCAHLWGTSEWLRAGRRILARMHELQRTDRGIAA